MPEEIGVWMERKDIERAVMEAISEVFRNGGREPPPLHLHTCVDSSLGLDSLDWAEVVVRLEAKLGCDPFESSVSAEINVIEDLVRLYETVLNGGEEAASTGDDR